MSLGFGPIAVRLSAWPGTPEQERVNTWGRAMMAIAKGLGIALLAIPLFGFAAYALRFGIRGLGVDLTHETYIYTPDGLFTNAAIFSHMVLGGGIMILAPLQLIGHLRRRYPRAHRITGRAITIAALVVALGGLGYIAIRGTLAGPLMDAGFALYGVLMFGAAVQTLRFARTRDLTRHSAWALRLFVLIMGSLIYRLHYVIWYLVTGGLWSNEQLDGPFDQIQYFAFYLPYLAALEFWIRRRGRQGESLSRAGSVR